MRVVGLLVHSLREYVSCSVNFVGSQFEDITCHDCTRAAKSRSHCYRRDTERVTGRTATELARSETRLLHHAPRGDGFSVLL
jgi:hypothetical protein